MEGMMGLEAVCGIMLMLGDREIGLLELPRLLLE
jgi:hypothetical protein